MKFEFRKYKHQELIKEYNKHHQRKKKGELGGKRGSDIKGNLLF